MSVDQHGIIPADVAKFETAAFDFLKRMEAGTVCPFARRLDSTQRGENLKRLSVGLGHRYAGCTLQSFEVYDDRQRDVLARLVEFARKMPEHLRTSGGLIFYGDAGTGKDHLLAALLKIAIGAHGLEVAWYDGGELFDEFYFAIKADSESDLKRLVSGLRKPHILAVSDPQPPQGPLSDSQIRRLRDVIDRRYRAGVSTWLTTNLDRKEDAEALLTAPLLQRIKEGSGTILCDWPSYRELKKASW